MSYFRGQQWMSMFQGRAAKSIPSQARFSTVDLVFLAQGLPSMSRLKYPRWIASFCAMDNNRSCRRAVY